jgi:hypothetical protein
VNGGTLIFGWSFTAAAAIALALSLTTARRTPLGRTPARWLLVICLFGGSVRLATMYINDAWPSYLLWIIGPVVLAVIAAEFRFRSARKRSS